MDNHTSIIYESFLNTTGEFHKNNILPSWAIKLYFAVICSGSCVSFVSVLALLRCKRSAGLRGKMYVGYACMNDLVIVQTGQGFLRYLEKQDKELLQKNGIVIGYDGRHNSKHWAELTAAIFLHAGYPVKLFSMVVPTPYIPFSTRKYKCASGIMVTASHNPKEDNGYKVYGPNSAQIIPPVDKEIQQSIMQNLEPWPTSWDKSILSNNPLLSDPLSQVTCNYLGVIFNDILPEFKEINMKQKLLITHSAMHGVGTPYVKKVFDGIGITFQTVPEQQDPDPEFSTVKFPNPEEGKSSLDLAFKMADQHGSLVILANDPDADRLACAEKQTHKNEWKVFTGNELGALFGWWMLFQYRKKNPGKSLENIYMICSTVSSMILKTMAKAEGFQFLDTLTGFKWIGNKALEIEAAGKTVLFCFEEAIGFMTSTAVVDKDGVSAAYQLATCASYLYSQGKTLNQQIQEIYDQYGTLSLMLQLSLIDVFLPFVALMEILTINRNSWRFSSELCWVFNGGEVLFNTLTLWLTLCLNFHVISLWNLHSHNIAAYGVKNTSITSEESSECLVTRESVISNETCRPNTSKEAAREISIDYRKKKKRNDVSIKLPSAMIWFICFSLSIPNFVLSAVLNFKDEPICVIIEHTFGHILQWMLLFFRALLPIPLLLISVVILILKLAKPPIKDKEYAATKEIRYIKKVVIFSIAISFLYLIGSCQRVIFHCAHISMHDFHDKTIEKFKLPPLYNKNLDSSFIILLSMFHYSSCITRALLCLFLLPKFGELVTDKVFICRKTRET
nr:unnamed protein product [Callosobruchus chinensis]